MGAININNYEAFLLDYSEGTLSAQDLAALKAFVMAHPELAINLDDMQLPAFLPEIQTPNFKNELKKTESDKNADDILNYIEGDLLPAQKAAFEKRMTEDKVLATELESYRKTILAAGTETFGYKSSLIKTEDDLILNNAVIAYVEGQLPASETIKFEQALKEDMALVNELALVLQTRLVADAAVIYPDKEALKKENRIIALFSFRNVAAMAAAVLLLFGLVVVFNYNNNKPAWQKEYAGKQKNTPAKPVEPVMIPEAITAEKNGKTIASNKTAITGQQAHEQAKTNSPSKQKPAVTKHEVIAQPETVAKHNENNQTPSTGKFEKPAALIPSENIANNNAVLNAPDTAVSNLQNVSGQDYLVVIGDADEDIENNSKPKNGFWKRAVKVARQANKLGVKAIDGEEKSNSFHLSFNAFSVEKK